MNLLGLRLTNCFYYDLVWIIGLYMSIEEKNKCDFFGGSRQGEVLKIGAPIVMLW
jgi:hypothetical protein